MAAKTAKATELVDIHARFVLWFVWGFFQSLVIPLGGSLLVLLAMAIHPTFGTLCMGLNGCGLTCGGLAWWVTGIVWRFRSDGAFAAGDIVPEGTTIEEWDQEVAAEGSFFQYRSGKFMFFYYVICWSLIASTCLCSVFAAIYSCFSAKK